MQSIEFPRIMDDTLTAFNHPIRQKIVQALAEQGQNGMTYREILAKFPMWNRRLISHLTILSNGAIIARYIGTRNGHPSVVFQVTDFGLKFIANLVTIFRFPWIAVEPPQPKTA